MPVEIEVDTVLFDMDGTLVDSTPAINATWKEFCDEFHLDYDYVVRPGADASCTTRTGTAPSKTSSATFRRWRAMR